MKKILFYLSFLILFSGVNSNLSASGKIDSLINTYNLKRADKAFENMAYIKAIDIYSNLIKKEFINDHIYRNIAFACLKTEDIERAIRNYRLLVNGSNFEAEDIYNYAQALKFSGDYQESDRWMKKYSTLNSEDTRIERQLNSNEKITAIRSINKYDIESVTFNSKYSDFGPALREDILYFASERRDEGVLNYEYAWKEDPYLDIYEVNLEGTVVNPKFLKGKVNSKFHDGPVCFSKDGQEMFFTRNNTIWRIFSKRGEDKVNNLKIYYSQLVNNEFNTPIELSFNSENYSCGHPSLSPDGSTLYFTSDMPGGYGGADIYLTERTGSGWSKPENLGPEINTEGNEMFPYILESGTLFFASDGHLGFGGLDLFKAKLDYGKYKIENMEIDSRRYRGSERCSWTFFFPIKPCIIIITI